jgi:hypothetical protein
MRSKHWFRGGEGEVEVRRATEHKLLFVIGYTHQTATLAIASEIQAKNYLTKSTDLPRPYRTIPTLYEAVTLEGSSSICACATDSKT